ncbi:AMP-binding protein [Leptothoe spongobia]|uniref:AMP-binding protein n=1 Tax=Leptothoe spongobia TAU-MAC 1115 TaxID=1967444 RepID=A0A947DD26_9CYAN|nr:AMP-binding protein [Leptothoe spongobia]MBT9314827.1 AMP-binding protein [Leptothoe spongobia TAU-MAC 1115]
MTPASLTNNLSTNPSAWYPTSDQIQSTNITALQQQLGLDSYEQLYQWSIDHRDQFWHQMIQRLGIQFQQPYSTVLDLSNGIEQPHWLVNARFNIVESCFLAPQTETAVIFQQPGGPLQRWTYGELERLTNRVANGLVTAGYGVGDEIAVIMPMTVQAVVIYLAIIKMGGVVVSIADSFAPVEIATRLHLSRTKAVFTQVSLRRRGKDLPLYSKLVTAVAPRAVVIPTEIPYALRPGDLTWDDFLSDDDQFTAIPCDAKAPLNILFSSGTTGTPKAIPWTHTTPIKCATDGHLHHDIHPEDVIAWPTSLGWMMGPWLIYAAMINQATIALYDDAPLDRGFGTFVQAAGVTLLGVVPSLVSAWRRSGCMTGIDWHQIKAFSSTGECSNPGDMAFLMALGGHKPVIEYCGGTEIGGGYITGTLVQPAYPSTFSTPALGLAVVILDDQGHASDRGEAFIIPPSMGLSTTLLNRDHHQVYFADTPAYPRPLRRHGDRLVQLANGYYQIQGRVDDTMNLGGIKISAVEIERVLQALPNVQEVAAISSASSGPSELVIYAVLTPSGQSTQQDLQNCFQQAIRQCLNPLFQIKDVVIVETLPRTASQKILRRDLRAHYQGQESMTQE